MTVNVALSPPLILEFFNNQQKFCAGGNLLTQVSNVNYPTYQDSAGSTPLPNPIPLNSRGEISNSAGASCQLYLATGVTYTMTLYDGSSAAPPYGNQIWQATVNVAPTNNIVANTAAISASNYTAYGMLFLEGYYSSGDAGGGMLAKLASPTTANNVTIFNDSAGNSFQRIGITCITPAMSGLQANNTDEGSALLNMLAVGHSTGYGIQFDGRTYLTSQNIVLDGSKAPPYIFGYSSTIKATGAITGNLLKIENPQNAFLGFSIMGLTFDSNHLCSVGIYIHGSQNCRYSFIKSINALGSVATSDGIGIKINGEPGFGVYYNEFNNLLSGSNGASNGGSGFSVKSINNSGGFFIASNDWHGCKSQWNHGFGWDLDYCSDGGHSMDAEANDLSGFSVNNSYSLTFTGGYSEVNNQNWAKNGGTATTSLAVSALSGSIGGFTATASAANHGCQSGQVIKMSGASDAAFNTAPGAAVQIVVIDQNTFTYTTVNAIANASPAGPITCSIADTSFILRPFIGTTNSVSLGVQVYGGRHIGEGHNFTAELSCWYNPANYGQNQNHLVGSDEYGNLNMERPRIHPQALPYSSSIDLSSLLNGGEVVIGPITAALTITAFPPLNLVTDGTEIKVTTVQDGTGSWATTLPSGVSADGGSYPASGANKIDSVVFKANRTRAKWYEDRRSTNMSA